MGDPFQLIIGIGGVSQSGKSTLAEKIGDYLSKENIRWVVFNQDDYVLPKDQLPIINGLTDWERPDSIDWKKLNEAVIKSKETNQVILIEGLFAFNHATLNKQLTHLFYLEIDKETFWVRKNKDTRWTIPPDWYIEYIWDAHHELAIIPENVFKIDSRNTINVQDILPALKLHPLV